MVWKTHGDGQAGEEKLPVNEVLELATNCGHKVSRK